MENDKKNRVLLIANVAKEHVLKFHIPTIKMLRDKGWVIDVACGGDEEIPYCNKRYKLSCNRSPLNLKLIKAIKEAKKIIKNERYDIIYCHTAVGGIIGRLIAKKAKKDGTKIIYFAHGYHFYKGAPLLNKTLFYFIEKKLSKLTDSIILSNKEDYELTLKKFKNKRTYLLNSIGVNLEKIKITEDYDRETYRKELNLPLDATVLIYCAELSKNKNQKYLLDVLKKLLHTKPNVYMLLVGNDCYNGKLQSYAKKIGVDENVRFLGWRNDVGNLYATSDICTASSIKEGFGINIVEAMKFKLPIIATNNSGHNMTVKDGYNGFLVNLEDEDTFVKRLIEVIDNKELSNEIVNNALLDIDQFSSKVVLKQLEKILEEHIS